MKSHFSIRAILSFLFHVGSLLIILFFFLPIAKWYFFHRPILGVDFFNTVTYVRFFKEHFHILPYGFRYFWYGGSPIAKDILISWFVAFSFLARVFSLLESVKIVSVLVFSLLALFTYLASFRLSKNQFISALITVLVVYSANMYGALIWGGSLPYFANQLFFPCVLWLLTSYLQTGNRRWYFTSVLVVGLSFLGHLANGTTFVFVGSAILLLFGARVKSVSFFHRIKDVLLLFVLAYFFTYRTASYFEGLILQALHGSYGLGGGSAAKVAINQGSIAITGNQDLIAFERSHFLKLFSDTNIYLFFLLALALILFFAGFIFDKHKRNAWGVLAWLLLVGYSVLHVFLNSYGINFMAQGWYRAFWHFPIALGLFIASLIGYFSSVFGTFFKSARIAVFFVISIASIILLGNLWHSKTLEQTIQLLEAGSSPASGHPGAIDLVRNNTELELIKGKLLPSFIDPNNLNYRVYTSDAQVNVWWNALYDIPLVRWYIDPPLGIGVMGNNFLLDQSVTGDGLVTNFKYPKDAAFNMALYYIDWYAVKYLEGGHLSNSANNPPSSYLKDSIDKSEDVAVKGAYILYQTKSGKPEVWEDLPQYLKYYRFKDELVTPILSVSNSPSVLCFCDWPAYESVTRILGTNNINSKLLTSVFYPDTIDSLSLEQLSNFDAIILINYKYGNKNIAFSNLLNFVKNGGKLFIDTGSEVPESLDTNLSEIFPFRSGERGGLGRNWDLSFSKDLVFNNIDSNLFSPPLYNENEWKFSYPNDAIDSSSQILLKNHNKPLLIVKTMGKGKVLWSGLNLAYHVQTYINQTESKLFINLLNSFVPLTLQSATFGTPHFIDDRTVEFSSNSSGRGILFKEQFFLGWNAKINGKETKAYQAGPTYPGFIYVPLDKGLQGPIKVEFTYWAEFYDYFPRIVTLFTLLFLLDMIFLNGCVISLRLNKLFAYGKQKLGSWWKKEDEIEN